MDVVEAMWAADIGSIHRLLGVEHGRDGLVGPDGLPCEGFDPVGHRLRIGGNVVNRGHESEPILTLGPEFLIATHVGAGNAAAPDDCQVDGSAFWFLGHAADLHAGM